MRVLLVHNHYLQPGGEDQVFSAEAEVLRANGVEVREYTQHNRRVATMGKLRLARSTFWNREVFDDISLLLREYAPDLVHCHNTFPLISPAVYTAARRWQIPVVQTLHNFRLLCLNGLFLRDGRHCEDCLGHTFAWPGVLHRCYRGSRQASTVAAAMIGLHRSRGTWQNAVDTYIALSQFARTKFIAGGLPKDRIVVKPNFLPYDPGRGTHRGGFALYVGRLSVEKGVASLVDLWERCALNLPLRVIGSGPLANLAASSPRGIEWAGWLPRDQVLAAMKEASFLVFPTECYEGVPIVLLEAMATGLPIVASNQGSLPELIQSGRSGMLVDRDSAAWENALRWASTLPDALPNMGEHARQRFETGYTAEVGYQQLTAVYQRVVESRLDHRSRATFPR